MQKQKILITGASGFIGSALVRELCSLGHDVHIFARPSSQFELMSNLKFTKHFGSLTDSTDIIQALKGCDYFYHLAGAIGYKKSQRQNMFQVNLEGTRACVEAALKTSTLKRMIYMSSVVTVGASWSANKVLDETATYNMKAYNLGYFESKKEAEDLVLKSHQKQNLPVIILNPSTVYGPGDMLKGSRKTQLKVAQGRFLFYPPGGVSVARLQSVVEALVAAQVKGRFGERYILAGENISVKKLFQLIAQKNNVSPPRFPLSKAVMNFIGRICEIFKLKAFDRSSVLPAQMFHYYSSKKAELELGYQPELAEKSIEESLNWSRDHKLI